MLCRTVGIDLGQLRALALGGVRADPAEATNRIAALDQVKKVTHERSRDGWEEFAVLVESGTDGRERLAALSREENWPLRTLHRHDATLEDVFVELTRKD